MIINLPKPIEEIKEMLADFKNVFILGCGGCPIGCDSGGPPRLNDVKRELSDSGKIISGTQIIDFLCNKALVGAQLRYQIYNLKNSDAILVVSCGVGVQATAAMIDLPVLPANNTFNNQGMQGLWPSVERCDGCGDCVLYFTGGICPQTVCPKGLMNGPCGGTNNGKCEVDKNKDCAWTLIYRRLEKQGRLDKIKEIHDPRDFQKSKTQARIIL